MEILCRTAARGVTVDVLLPGPGADKRVCQLASENTYATLQDAGVRVWNFQPAMMHAKIMMIDGIAAMTGSSNFNRRSLDHDEEVMLIALDNAVTRRLVADFDSDLTRSREIDRSRWSRRSVPQRVAEVATKPLRRWL